MTGGADEPFAFVDRVRFADLDARGHLNNVAFLEFFEAARLAFIRHVDPSHDPTRASGRDLILAHTSIDYRSPAAFEEEIRTLVRPVEVERGKFRIALEMRSTADERLLAEGENVIVGYDYEADETSDIPPPLYEGLRRLGG